jgi:hypothetical protein
MATILPGIRFGLTAFPAKNGFVLCPNGFVGPARASRRAIGAEAGRLLSGLG